MASVALISVPPRTTVSKYRHHGWRLKHRAVSLPLILDVLVERQDRKMIHILHRLQIQTGSPIAEEGGPESGASRTGVDVDLRIDAIVATDYG